MRKRISSNLGLGKYLMIFVGILSVFGLIYFIQYDKFHSEAIVVPSIILIISIILYFLFDKAKTVEYDKSFMYVIYKENEEKIPLEDITKIKLTMTKINNSNMWKIGYLDKTKMEKSVRILPRMFGYKEFKEFKNRVKELNKDVRIINWSHSFDFDQ